MRLKIISKPDEQFWKSFDVLSSKCFDHHVQLKSAWLRPYINNQLDGEIYIICVYDREELVGCLPLQTSKQKATRFWNYRILGMLGYGPTDFYEILACGNKDKVKKMILQHLVESSSWDILNINFLPANSSSIDSIQEVFKRPDFELKKKSITGFHFEKTDGDWQEYYRNSFKKKNKDLQKGERRLKKDEIHYSFTTYRKDVYDHFIADVSLYAERRESLGQYNYYEDKKYREFLKEVCNNYEKNNNVELTKMQDQNGVSLAIQLDFISNNVRYHWNHAFNEDFKRYSPGKILLQELLKKAFETDSIKSCNHMRGLSSYKEKFTTFEEKLISYQIQRNSSLVVKATKVVTKSLKLIKR